MSGLVRRLTSFFGFKIINYDFPRWHNAEWDNWDAIDTLLNSAGLTNVSGVWTNNTLYTVGQRLIDADEGSIWICAVGHTSASSGLFAADRIANPTYWTAFSTLPNYRGAWTTATAYLPGDIVVVSTYAYYYCVASHTSSALFATDSSKWTLVFDATAAVSTTASNASAAAASAASAAATFDTKILLSSINLLSDVDTATVTPTVGTGLVWDGTNYVPGPAGGGMFKGDAGTVGNRAGDIFRITEQQLDANTTIAATENAHAPGPMTIASGITLTISSGGNLVIT